MAIQDQPIHQQVRSMIFSKCQELGYNVHLTLPPADAEYPFVWLRYTNIHPKATSSGLVGEIFTSISIYGKEEMQYDVSEMTEKLFSSLQWLDLGNRRLSIIARKSTQGVNEEEITQDVAQMKGIIPQTLIRGQLDLYFNIQK